MDPADFRLLRWTVIDSRSASSSTRAVGSPRFLTNLSVCAVPNHPGRPTGCVCSLLLQRWQASSSLAAWPPTQASRGRIGFTCVTAHTFASEGFDVEVALKHRLVSYMSNEQFTWQSPFILRDRPDFPGAPKPQSRKGHHVRAPNEHTGFRRNPFRITVGGCGYTQLPDVIQTISGKAPIPDRNRRARLCVLVEVFPL
jgi:hypothetical protein